VSHSARAKQRPSFPLPLPRLVVAVLSVNQYRSRLGIVRPVLFLVGVSIIPSVLVSSSDVTFSSASVSPSRSSSKSRREADTLLDRLRDRAPRDKSRCWVSRMYPDWSRSASRCSRPLRVSSSSRLSLSCSRMCCYPREIRVNRLSTM
jgi:hypothetical protein